MDIVCVDIVCVDIVCVDIVCLDRPDVTLYGWRDVEIQELTCL